MSARDPKSHGVTLSEFLSPMRHMEQLLLVTSCDSPARIGASLRTHQCTTEGRTDFYVETRKYLLRGYILGAGAPRTTGVNP